VNYEILPGLPPYGPLALPCPPDFGRSGREGYVVRFLPNTPNSWVGNFAGGLGGYTGVHPHPDGRAILVFAHGQGYVVDPPSRRVREEVGGAIFNVWRVEGPDGLILDQQGLAFQRYSRSGLLWHTRRLSWDGFRDVHLSSHSITGLAWTPIGERWLPFRVDIQSGRSEGGSYEGPDNQRWERLANTA
jgi:hypothetical protein